MLGNAQSLTIAAVDNEDDRIGVGIVAPPVRPDGGLSSKIPHLIRIDIIMITLEQDPHLIIQNIRSYIDGLEFLYNQCRLQNCSDLVYLKFDVFILQNFNIKAYCGNGLDIFLSIVLQSV